MRGSGADRWVSMPNGAHLSRGRGRASVEAGPSPAPWRSALSLTSTPLPRNWITALTASAPAVPTPAVEILWTATRLPGAANHLIAT
jgi:hypothetical protein